MNESLSSREVHTCLLLLECALVRIRAACWSKDLARAEALADAFHNLPRLLLEGRNSWTIAGFERLFLDELVAKYPEFAGMQHELRAARSRP
jgi:hypothetical protein